MIRSTGTIARGIITPIIKEGDNLTNFVVDSLLLAAENESFSLNDNDVLGITESLVARAQGNFIHIDDITKEISMKFNSYTIGVLFPILSRNRFAQILKAIALTGKKVYVFLSYPSDEMGNQLMPTDSMFKSDLNPHTDILTESQYRNIFGENVCHPFTGIDYVRYYKDLALNNNIEIILANNPEIVLNYVDEVLVANVHDRYRIKNLLENSGAKKVLTLDELLTEPKFSKGYNDKYGLLGSNMATDTTIKLFPRDCENIVYEIQAEILKRTGKLIEVMVYGDGAFKDPVGKIWELADPVVSPGYTSGLEGTPNEVKLKYIADSQDKNLSSEEMNQILREHIRETKSDIRDRNENESLGTTPRRITDLLGSLCDLVSGSGDKGTPIVLVQNYFKNFASE